MTKPATQAIALVVAVAAAIATNSGVETWRQRRAQPLFVDINRVFQESVVGREAAAQYQMRAGGRRQRASAAAAEAAKLAAGSKERAAKEQEAQQLAATEAQQDQADGRDVDTAFRKRVGEVTASSYSGRVVLPVSPLSGGEDVTDEVKRRLDAANVDAVGERDAARAEVERLRRQLADRQPGAAGAHP